MARRYERQQTELKKQVTKQTSTAITISAIAALVSCALINAIFGAHSVPDLVFWILAAVIAPDVLKFLRDGRS